MRVSDLVSPLIGQPVFEAFKKRCFLNGKNRQRGSTKNGPSGPSFFRGFFEHQFSVIRTLRGEGEGFETV